MMTNQSPIKALRSHVLLAFSASLLLAFTFRAYTGLHREAQAAIGQVYECRRQADEISRLKSRPVFAPTSVEDLRSITRRIEIAQRSAKIPNRAIDLVDPQNPMQIGDSVYRLRPVAIDLRGLSLTQTIRFVDALTDQPSGIWVNQIRLNPIRTNVDEKNEERWNIELVLTQVNYSPTTR